MNKIIVLEVYSASGRLLINDWMHKHAPNAAFYTTFWWVRGNETDVLIVSSVPLTSGECKKLAVAYMTGGCKRFTADLNSDNPHWEEVK